MTQIEHAYFLTNLIAGIIASVVSLVFASIVGIFMSGAGKLDVPMAIAFAIPLIGAICILNAECDRGYYQDLTAIKNQAEHVKPEVVELIKDFSKDGKITLYEFYVVKNLSNQISIDYEGEQRKATFDRIKNEAIK